MRAICVALVAAAALLAGCETPPAATGAATSVPPSAANAARCDKREVTGSRLARCDNGPAEVRTISRQEIEATGMPSSGGARGSGEGR